MPRRQKKKQKRGSNNTNHNGHNTSSNYSNNKTMSDNDSNSVSNGNTLKEINGDKTSVVTATTKSEPKSVRGHVDTLSTHSDKKNKNDINFNNSIVSNNNKNINNNINSNNNGTGTGTDVLKHKLHHTHMNGTSDNSNSSDARQRELERSVIDQLCNQQPHQHQNNNNNNMSKHQVMIASRDVLVSRDWLSRWQLWVDGASKRPGPVVSAGLLSRGSTRGRVRSRSRSHSLARMTAAVDINSSISLSPPLSPIRLHSSPLISAAVRDSRFHSSSLSSVSGDLPLFLLGGSASSSNGSINAATTGVTGLGDGNTRNTLSSTDLVSAGEWVPWMVWEALSKWHGSDSPVVVSLSSDGNDKLSPEELTRAKAVWDVADKELKSMGAMQEHWYKAWMHGTTSLLTQQNRRLQGLKQEEQQEEQQKQQQEQEQGREGSVKVYGLKSDQEKSKLRKEQHEEEQEERVERIKEEQQQQQRERKKANAQDTNKSKEIKFGRGNGSIRTGTDGGCCYVCRRDDLNLFRCSVCHVVQYCSVGCQASHWNAHRQVCTSQPVQSLEQKMEPRYGRTGLTNLGNTCFMSSAVQCLSHTWPLTRYFLRQDFKKDINVENTFGTGGSFALVWYALLKELWLGDSRVVTPLALKRAIGCLPGSANQFAGFMQHDAQELLVFLLDTLHEDLNLISKKPYIELADIDGRSDDVRQCAADAWVNTWKREKSFVFDLFQGQTQSTLECPSCGHQSITFEAFMSLPLAIPENSHRVVHLTLVRRLLNNNKNYEHNGSTTTMSAREIAASLHERMAVRVLHGSYFFDVKEQVSKLSGVPVEDMWVVLVHKNNKSLQAQYHDNTPVDSYSASSGSVIVYELEPLMPGEVSPLPHQSRAQVSGSQVGTGNVDVEMEHSRSTPLSLPAAESTNTIVMMHRVRGRHQGGRLPVLLATPVILQVGPDTTFNQLRARVAAYVPLAGVPLHNHLDGPIENSASSDKVFNPALLPLYLVDIHGKTVGENELKTLGLNSACVPGESGDAGRGGEAKVIETVGRLEDEYVVFMGLDWDADNTLGQTMRFDITVAEAETVHDSVAAEQVAQEQEGGASDDGEDDGIDQDRNNSSSRINRRRKRREAKGVPLERCLRKFLQREQLDEGNTWRCPKCKVDQRASKSISLRRLPDVLVVFLKRFEHRAATVVENNQNGGMGADGSFADMYSQGINGAGGSIHAQAAERVKLSTLVQFPTRGLDMAPFTWDGDVASEYPPVYDLYGVINHYGSMGYGHYTAFVRNEMDDGSGGTGAELEETNGSIGHDDGSGVGSWSEIDDKNCYIVDEDQICSKAAYVLFYRRRRE